MDFWQKARSFAEEAAKRSQELTKEAAKRSQELTVGASKFSDIVSETAKRSKEFAAEASKRAEQIRLEALKQADKIKHLADGVAVAPALMEPSVETQEKDLEAFGITEELRDFVRGITISTFQDFPLEDDTQFSDIPTVSNVSQDLTEWQAKHANLVLSTVKEISKLRYELCPRVMRERKFWRIYFILVNNHVAPYEKRYVEDMKLKSAEHEKVDKAEEPMKDGITSEEQVKDANHQSKTATSSSAEQDLDAFLLGDPGDSDDGPDKMYVILLTIADAQDDEKEDL
ncbi:hypothetical protein FEM48_Zijuj05G0122700 [Ziziphus jujuba var. spinosa]|uniref:BSD domain-containing protein n=1 Tax=Ziziphus jujuba var. spinosa TaxID=714518 RepID=A0A978VES1_ZIZJJ|nr:hypothetical protein FEM48_Zijuj05G0122700 [Ziziphus jujuba var. spinosa]